MVEQNVNAGLQRVCGALVGCSSDDDGIPAQASPDEQWLYIMTANAAAIEPAAGTTEGFDYALTLESPSLRVTRFADRPYRDAATVMLDDFLQMWNEGTDSFVKDPPHAAVEYLDGAQTPKVHVVELAAPVRSSQPDTLTFETRDLAPYSGLSHYEPGASPLETGSFEKPLLFIDDGPSVRCGSATCEWGSPDAW